MRSSITNSAYNDKVIALRSWMPPLTYPYLAAESNTSTCVAYIKTQLDLDTGREFDTTDSTLHFFS